MTSAEWIQLAQWIIGIVVGGGIMRLYIEWRKDRHEAREDDLDLASLMRKAARDEVAAAYVQIKELRSQYEAEVQKLSAKVSLLEERDELAMNYIATLLKWIGAHVSSQPPTPPRGLRIPGWGS